MRLFRTSILVIAAAVLVAAGPVESANALGPKAKAARSQMLQLVNNARRNHNVRPLAVNWRLSGAALRHSRRMASRNFVYHNADLGALVRRYHPNTWGENVGAAGTLGRMHSLFMGSAPHRANILNRSFRRIGVGVMRSGPYFWVTLDFYG